MVNVLRVKRISCFIGLDHSGQLLSSIARRNRSDKHRLTVVFDGNIFRRLRNDFSFGRWFFILLLILIDVVVNEFRLRLSLKSRFVKICVRIFVRKSKRLSFFFHRLAIRSFEMLGLLKVLLLLMLWYMRRNERLLLLGHMRRRRRDKTLLLVFLLFLSPESKVFFFVENLCSLVKWSNRRKVVELFRHFRPWNRVGDRRVRRRGWSRRPVLVFEERSGLIARWKASNLVRWEERLVLVDAFFTQTRVPSKLGSTFIFFKIVNNLIEKENFCDLCECDFKI